MDRYDEKLDRLARRSRMGDRAALEQLCAALEEHISRYCRALLDDTTLAQDTAQDVFVRLVRALPGWRAEAPVRVFVLLLARRAVIDAVRAEARHRRRGRVAPVRGEEPDAAEMLVLEDLMRGLPDDQLGHGERLALVGLPYAEVAAVRAWETTTLSFQWGGGCSLQSPWNLWRVRGSASICCLVMLIPLGSRARRVRRAR